MNTRIDNHDCVRVWPDGSTTMLEVNGHKKFQSIIVSRARCDDIYNLWAASDFGGSFFEYLQICEDGEWDSPQERIPLTDADAAIFARQWFHGIPPIAMTEGDHRDTDIMRLYGELHEAHGGNITVDDLNHIEEMSYVYWSGHCSPDYDFAPIHLT